MKCDNNWTIALVGIDGSDFLEIRPRSMNLKLSRNKYDYCRASFSTDVNEILKPYTSEDNILSGLTSVEVRYNGTYIKGLLLRPDWIDYGSELTHIQFKDRHKALSSGTVDIKKGSAQLKDVYKEVFNQATNDIIDDISFTTDLKNKYLFGGNTKVWGKKTPKRKKVEDEMKETFDSSFAVDFDKITPELAIRKLNKKFSIKSWINRNDKLVIGRPTATQVRHIAAPNDGRVWRYKDPSISHSREPIMSVMVEGAWEDEPGFDPDVTDWFDKGGTADVRATGLAQRTDVSEGKQMYLENTKAKKDALSEIAVNALKEKSKQQNSGTIEIDPNLSGNVVSHPVDLTPGDALHLIPNDEYFDSPTATSGEIGDEPPATEICGGFVNNEVYLVTAVDHNKTDGGDWQIHVDISKIPDFDIESRMVYFDPKSEEFIGENKRKSFKLIEAGVL